MLFIRGEQPEDSAAIRKVHELAFGRPAEADLVDVLRARGKATLSLVALQSDRVVGHILFSPVTIASGERAFRGVGLAPMAVLPERQRQGIGSQLVKAGLIACRNAGYDGVVVLGHPTYFPRFGFVPASRYGITSEYGVPDEAFMILPWHEGIPEEGLQILTRSREASMTKELISYLEMCRREGARLRRGMHFGHGGTYSVLLMSVQARAPYRDRAAADGLTLIYEGHDEPKSVAVPHPKAVDQPFRTAYGTATQNAKFHRAAQAYKCGQQAPERVRIYEKCRPGLWVCRGMFHLVDSWQEHDGKRQVWKFKLMAVDGQDDGHMPVLPPRPRRSIPRAIRITVWQRDGGKCVVCGGTDNLHFDHIVPISKGGTSNTANNIQLLCARHNLAKGARLS